MNPDNTFWGAYLKVQRAYAHINELIAISQPLAPGLYEVTWVKAVGRACGSGYANFEPGNPDSTVMELTYFPKGPIPQIFALIIGDTIHNLRSALDYAATAVVRAANLDTKFVTFPFHEEREKLVAAQTTGIRQIQAALPGADVEGFFQNTIKTYRDGNPDLWALSKADKVDKHNFIVPTIAAGITQIPFSDITSPSGRGIIINGSVGGDASRPFGLIRADFRGAAPDEIKVNVSANVSFPHGEFFGSRQVIPTLTNLAQLVLETLRSLEDFAVAAGLYPEPIPR